MNEDILIDNQNVKPEYNITFQNENGEVGRLEFEGDKMVFKGDVEESAKVFFDYLLKNIVDGYMEQKLVEYKLQRSK